ncbi:MAG: NAD-dependent epimerase/dehydratase family protein, partial [Actinobacteria bacterium]|nr:NAD-dependent epimerase/dehydratase family protein [Actinomycetota bacterium]
MRVLVTGGAGYIGSTAADILMSQGYEVSVFDDCSTGHADNVATGVTFIQGSLLNRGEIAQSLKGCDAVMHFAGKSLVGESVEKPELYWSVNVGGTRNLLDEMRAAKISKLIFSSSAATYGEPEVLPILETASNRPTNAYGASKLAVDAMITDEARGHGLSAASLRYFNVAGAHKSSRGWLIERHNPETHLIPNVLRSSSENPVKIFGSDWPTKDGTCIRDYVHV